MSRRLVLLCVRVVRGDTKLGLSSAPVVFGVDTAKHPGAEPKSAQSLATTTPDMSDLPLSCHVMPFSAAPRYMAPIIKDSVQLTIVGYLFYIGDSGNCYGMFCHGCMTLLTHVSHLLQKHLLQKVSFHHWSGETNYALGLLALIVPQVYFAITLFLEDPIKNDVTPGLLGSSRFARACRAPMHCEHSLIQTKMLHYTLAPRKYQGSSLPFFSIGTIVAASAIGNNPLH